MSDAPTNAAAIEPYDDHNRRLIDNVHPNAWTNPKPAKRYHLVVIGGGTAGLVSAAGAAGLGARVALIERHLLGGDCLNVGCVPSKGVISAARAWHNALRAVEFGGPTTNNDASFARAMERMRRLRANISSNDSAQRFADLGVDVFLGEGCFSGPDSITVGGAQLRFRRAVVATGARAALPPIPGLAEAGCLTNETVFSLTKPPTHLVIIGAGPIGCEMAQSFARLGSTVTVLDQADHVLPREDPDAAAVVQAAMARDGVHYIPGCDIESIATASDGRRMVHYRRGDAAEETAADEILVSVGRKPNVEGLGLEEAGIDYNNRGVVVNEKMRSSNKRVFACGDVASRYQFTHAADAQARIVIQNALFFGRARADRLVMPWCTFTSPEIAHVGMYEHDAKDAGIDVDTITVPLAEVDRARLDGEDQGFLRIHVKRGSDKMVGATLVAEHAGDMIGELALAITAGVGLGKIAATIHPYPTQGEVIKKAADAWRRTKLTPTVSKIFRGYFRLTA